MASGNGIQPIPSHNTGDEYTEAMWQVVEDSINNGVVTQLGCDVSNTGNPSFGNNTPSTVAMAGEAMDTDGMHSTTVNNSRVTCQTAGFFEVGAYCSWAANASGDRITAVHKNGNPTYMVESHPAAVGGTTDFCYVGGPIYLNVGDYLELVVTQTSGAALTLNSAELVVVRL